MFLLTDGEVSDTQAVIAACGRLHKTMGARVFTFGIGGDVSHALVRGGAQQGTYDGRTEKGDGVCGWHRLAVFGNSRYLYAVLVLVLVQVVARPSLLPTRRKALRKRCCVRWIVLFSRC